MLFQRRRASNLLIILVAIILAAGSAHAQDAHYWDNQYGTKAQLLGGLVVGSPSDLSATYYNPGWVALGVDASLLVTTVAFEYSSLRFESALGDDFNPEQNRIATSPGFLAGRFNALKLEGWQLAWSYIERMRFQFDAAGILVDENLLPSQDGEIWASGEAFQRTLSEESWYGFTFSRRISEHTAFGATPYLVYRSQRQRIQASARVIDGLTRDGSLFVVDEFSFSHYRLLAKFGLAFDHGSVTYGVTLTTPGLGITGNGNVYSYASLSGVDLDGDDVPDDVVGGSAQEDLSASWKSPLSLAAGVAWRSGGTGLHFTAEWFAGVDQDQVLDPASFTSQTTGETIEWDLGFHQSSVLNFGLGVDHRFNERFALYGAIRTDWTTLDPDTKTDILMASWDLWHFSTGASFQFMGVEFTSGLQYSVGNGATTRFLDLTDMNAPPDTLPRKIVDVRYRRLKLVVGFDLAMLSRRD